MKRFLIALLIASPCLMARAGETVSLEGKIYSVTETEFVLLSGNELFHIKKAPLTQEQRLKLETASTHQISISVPMESIMNVRSAKPKPAGS